MNEASWKQAKDVLFDAQQLPASAREAYVRRHFANQPDVADEVLDILQDADTTSDALSRPAFRIDTRDIDELADLTPSTEIEQYKIVHRLRRGGMGQVFLAHDEKLQRPVALKCLLSRSSAEADRHKILAEARAAAAITHTNVARVYDVVEQRGRAFMVMEYVVGESLFDWLARERLPMSSVVDIGLDLVRALGAAHIGGVVHGDLKPANVQLTPEGSAKVLDFGVARVVRAAAGAESTTFATGRSAAPPQTVAVGGGTPAYMSPEQLRGERIDGQSDLYSLGVVLFEMATGRRLHSGETVGERLETANRPAPRADSIAAAVPQRLADVIAKALEPRIHARFQSAAEMEQALTPVRDLLVARTRRELTLRWLTRVAVGVPLMLLGLELVGFMTSIGLNLALGRRGPYARFGAESWLSNLQWGMVSVIPSAIVASMAAVVVVAGRFALSAAQAIQPVRRVCQRVGNASKEISVRLGLHRSTGLAQCLAAVALATLVIFIQLNVDVIFAWTSSVSTASAATFAPIGENNRARLHYNQVLDVAIPAFLYGLYWVIRLRRRDQTRDGVVAIALSVAVLAVMVLMRELPYRTLVHRDFERADFADKPCYMTGESGGDLLLLCPGDAPPRNRVVRRDDPRVHVLGTVENVFKGMTAAVSDP